MVQLLLLAIVSCCNLRAAISGWVDPDSPHSSKNTKSYIDNRQYELVFSDEFNTDNRIFHDGADPRWTAINKDDYTNYALHYYNASLVNTTGGYLNINTILKDVTFVADDSNPHSPKKTKVFQSGMIQGWNKFCFTGGIVEIRMKLPGRHDIGGLWPAMWLLGNLARATYVGSSNNVWPWSYDTCNKKIQHQQQFSACNRMNHFNMQPYHGRGAPEIDILEAMPGSEKLKSTPINRPYYSASFQVAPGIEGYRPNVGEKPVRKLWYNKGIEYGKNASENIFFWGMHLDGNSKAESYLADAISANRNIGSEHFDHFHTYRFEWKTGRIDGYLEWYLDEELVYKIKAEALEKTGAIIPEEPMYLLFNTAVSATWGFPQCPEGCDCECLDPRKDECSCALPPKMAQNFPATMQIDYVRVYQAIGDDDQIIGCSTPSHPSKKFIEGHQKIYKSAKDKIPLQEVPHGGGVCKMDKVIVKPTPAFFWFDRNHYKDPYKSTVGCGKHGDCVDGKCVCKNKDYGGPHCLAPNGFDDIVWDTEEPLYISFMIIPTPLIVLVLIMAGLLLAVVGYKYTNDKITNSVGRNSGSPSWWSRWFNSGYTTIDRDDSRGVQMPGNRSSQRTQNYQSNL